MNLLARIALLSAVFFGATLALTLLVWKPANERAYVSRTDRLLRTTEQELTTLATGLVDDALAFAQDAALAADEARAHAVQDLPLALYTDGDGRLEGDRLKQAVRNAVATPATAAAQRQHVVRAEFAARSRRDVARRLATLRRGQGAEAQRHARHVAWRTVAAWGGVLLLLLAGWAFALERFVLRPLRETTAAVERFGAGERGVRLAEAGAPEFHRLQEAFNATAGAVERAERDNNELRAGLEEKVRERTTALVRAARASTAGTMAGGVAHEFNNLLGGILGCAEDALSEDPAPDVREPIEMIRKTARRGVGVTSALLRATSAEPQPEPCAIGPLFDEVLAEVRPAPEIDVARDLEAMTVFADPAMLRQILANLVRNAVDAMRTGGTLTLGAAATDQGYVVSVADTGPGIDPAVQEILFEPFVSTRRGGREGVGLGLFLAERLVAAHGGHLEFVSTPGTGTRFALALPSARDS